MGVRSISELFGSSFFKSSTPRYVTQQPQYDDLTKQFSEMGEKARQANIARYGEAKGKFEQVEQMYAPGGGFGKGYAAQLERAKTKDVASGAQSLVSSGLYGTTTAAGLGKKWEEDVGTPARLKLEDVRMGRYAQALTGTAGLVERVDEPYPDYNLLMKLLARG